MRTISQFPLLAMLHESKELLIDYGGHDFAAGLTIDVAHVEAFKKSAKEHAKKRLKAVDFGSKLQIDAAVHFCDLNFDLLDALSLFEPYGHENPPPVFSSYVQQSWPPKVISSHHLKVYLEEEGRMLEGIGFGMAHLKSTLKHKFIRLKAAFTPQVNRFLNKTSIQLLIRNVQIVDASAGGKKISSTQKEAGD